MKKVAIVGCGMRMLAFAAALKERFAETHTIAALMDIDPGKMRGFARRAGLDTVPRFTDFDRLCAEIHPDLALIGTVDCHHAFYVIQCLDRKIAVISEKPLCINREQCLAIREAQRRNPEVFAVTSHNSRYRPVARKLKELLDSGVIGEPVSLEYRETLDRVHGKSYFRRWNSHRSCSNGLELHKSSHHFDKMNYLLGSRAVEVTASGALLCYGAKAPHDFEGVNCHSCPHAGQCPDFFQYDTELFDSQIYTPDQCIWSPKIDIEDHFCAGIRFANGVLANYSLSASADYEGEVIHVQGRKGRLEAVQLNYRSVAAKDIHNTSATFEERIRLFRPGEPMQDIPVEHRSLGAHGGADYALFSELFAPVPPPTLPTLEDGIQAVLTGAAVVESIQTGRAVRFDGA